jgi:peptidoglycan/xylan/chitin deacetylase (PgdA/CDA1 family)
MLEKKNAIPVLMYHSIVSQRQAHYHPTVILADQFSAQIQWLFTNGYQTVTPLEALPLLKNGNNTAKKVLITFDDGYKSYIDIALPILSQYGYMATLFVATSFIDLDSYPASLIEKDKLPHDDRPLTRQDILKLYNEGWQIEAHTATHVSLLKQDNTIISTEMEDANTYIETLTGQKPTLFAYPYGQYDSLSLDAARLHYTLSFTTHQGLWSEQNDKHRLPRLEMAHDDTLPIFIQKLTKGYSNVYDWLRNAINAFLRKNMNVYDFFK